MRKQITKLMVSLTILFMVVIPFSAQVLSRSNDDAITEAHISSTDKIKVYINDRAVDFDVAPIIINDRVMVPLRKIFESIGARIEWDDKNKICRVFKYNISLSRDVVMQIAIDNPVMLFEFSTISMDSPPIIKEDRTLVPLRAVSEAFGFDVNWDADSLTVYLKYEEKYDKSAQLQAVKNIEPSYDVSYGLPWHDAFKEGFSSSYTCGSMYIEKFGEKYASLYDFLLNIRLEFLHNEWGLGDKVRIDGADKLVPDFYKYVGTTEFFMADSAVKTDFPLLCQFVDVEFINAREVVHPITGENLRIKENKDDVYDLFVENISLMEGSILFKQIMTDEKKDSIIAEINKYREITKNCKTDEEKFMVISKEFMNGAVYEPYNAEWKDALLEKRGNCVASNMALEYICKAVGVSAYYLPLYTAQHSLLMVKTDGKPLMVADATFGENNVKYGPVSKSEWMRDIHATLETYNNMYNLYFPDYTPGCVWVFSSDAVERLGGIN